MLDVPILVRRDTVQTGRSKLIIDQRVEVERDANGNAEDVNDKADMAIARDVGQTLFSFYPGHLWFVHVSSKQGVCLINIPILMGGFKYVLKLGKGFNAMAVMRAGGQILERFNIPRSGIDPASFDAALKKAVSRPNHRMPG